MNPVCNIWGKQQIAKKKLKKVDDTYLLEETIMSEKLQRRLQISHYGST